MKYIIFIVLVLLAIYASAFITFESNEDAGSNQESGETIFSESLSSSALYKYTDKDGPEFANADSYAGGMGESDAMANVGITPGGKPEAFAKSIFKPASFLKNVGIKLKRDASNTYKNNPDGGQNFNQNDLGEFNIPTYHNAALPPQ